MQTENKFYTVEQLASLLQVHWQSVLNYIKRGDIEAVKIGRNYRISQVALNEFIALRTTRRGKQ